MYFGINDMIFERIRAINEEKRLLKELLADLQILQQIKERENREKESIGKGKELILK